MIDNKVSFYGGIVGPAAASHRVKDNSFTIRDSLFVGESDNFDCTLDDGNIPTHAKVYMNRRSPKPPGGKLHVELLKLIWCIMQLIMRFFVAKNRCII